jgi:hypothetical protein
VEMFRFELSLEFIKRCWIQNVVITKAAFCEFGQKNSRQMSVHQSRKHFVKISGKCVQTIGILKNR